MRMFKGRECLVCGKIIYQKFRMHLDMYHSLTPKDYFDAYLKQEGDDLCRECGEVVPFMELGYKYYEFCNRSCRLKYQHKQLKKDADSYKRWHSEAGRAAWKDPETVKRVKSKISAYQKQYSTMNQRIAEKKAEDPKYAEYLREVASKNGFGTLHKKEWFKKLRRKAASKQSMSQVLNPDNKWGTRSGKMINYKGNTFRSSWEYEFAVKLDEIDIPWEYECETFIHKGKRRYTPDFYISMIDLFVEIRPSNFIDDVSVKKLQHVKSVGHNITFVSEQNWDQIIEHFILIKENPKSLDVTILNEGGNGKDLRNSVVTKIKR